MTDKNFSLTLSQEQGFRFRVSFDQAGLPAITMDEPEPLGAGRGPNAARLLGAAIGHCLTASLLFCLQKSRVETRGVETAVSGTIVRNEAGRFRIGEINVSIAPEVTPEHHERMERCLNLFQDFCIVTESVRNGVDVSVQVRPATANV